jgi:hypothetical protein
MCKHSEHDSSSLEANPVHSVATKETLLKDTSLILVNSVQQISQEIGNLQ